MATNSARGPLASTVTIHIEYSGGNFYRCMTETGGDVGTLEPIVDPSLVFGHDASLLFPDAFLKHSLKAIGERPQVRVGRLPCAFAGTAL